MKLRKGRVLACILGFLGLLCIGGSIFYQINISPIDSNSKKEIEVSIPSGMSTEKIAELLEKKGLIRNAFLFRLYLKFNHISTLKASTYSFQKNMSTQEIVRLLEKGNQYNPDVITITFQEGKTIKQYAKVLAKKTNIQEEEFLSKMQDRTYIQSLISTYWFLTDQILKEEIYYPLEGYLAPDTYEFKNKEVSIEEVIQTLLNQTQKILKPYQSTFETQNVHDVLTLASISQLEGKSKEDQAKIVGVFQNRLKKGMNLGSDVTTYYAFQEEMDSDLTSEMFQTYNPYNTRSSAMIGKLPIGPICNPSFQAIDAALNPEENDYLYFVADKYGKIFYTKTEKEHLQKVEEIKNKGDWIW